MIDLAILGLLNDHDLHGYELRKRLGELPGSRPSVSFGSLYPALARMERGGLVKAVTRQSTPTPPSPMSGSLAGELAAFRAHRRNTSRGTRGTRGKKVYGITDMGRARLHELLTVPETSDDRDFALRLAFCHHLDPQERVAIFRRRRDDLLRRRDEQRHVGSSEGRLNRYLRSLLERDTETINADLAWLDRLLDAEQDAIAQGPSG